MKRFTLIGVLLLYSLTMLGQQTEMNMSPDRMDADPIGESIGITPNPAFDYIGFNLDVSVKVSVFNQQGVEVIPMTEVAPQELLYIADLPAGIYMVKMDTGSKIITWKFVKN